MRPKKDATSGCEVCPDARNALSCGGGAVEEDATTGCESGSRIFLFAAAIWPVVEFSEMYLGCNVLLQGIITCVNAMLTPGVGLGDVPLGA